MTAPMTVIREYSFADEASILLRLAARKGIPTSNPARNIRPRMLVILRLNSQSNTLLRFPALSELD